MAKGADTMIPKSKAEVFTPVDNLQLGHTEVNPEDVKTAEQEIKDLKEQVKMVSVAFVSLPSFFYSDRLSWKTFRYAVDLIRTVVYFVHLQMSQVVVMGIQNHLHQRVLKLSMRQC